MKFRIIINLRKFMKWLAIFMLGVIAGALIINILIGKKLDKAYMDNQNLASIVEDQKAHIETLESELGANQKILVKEIKPYVLHEDKYVRLEIEKIAKDLLTDLIGKEVENLDPILVSNILNNRFVTVDKVEYSLDVKALLVSEKILVYLKPKEKD